MKHPAESSRISIPFIDQDSLGGSQPTQYSPPYILRHGTHTSSRPLDPNSRHYLSSPAYSSAEHNAGQMSYPESSQRTVVSEDIKPCLPYTDEERGQGAIDTRLPFPTNDTFHLSSTQERMMSPPVVYHGSPSIASSHRTELRNSCIVGNISHPSPRALHSPLYRLSRPTPEKTELLDHYDPPSQLGSGVGTDNESYANYDADSPHDLGTPNQSLASSIPMRKDMGWSSASTLGTYDQARVPEAGTSCIIQDLDSSISKYRPSEHLKRRNHDPALPSSPPANETIKKKKSKMHQCEVCGKLFPRFEGCSRTFTVRSNAKRHLRTHGIETASSRQTSSALYSVGFDTPTVVPPPPIATQEMTAIPYKLRWMPPSLSTRTNATSLVSVSDDESSNDECSHGPENQHKSLLTLPCPPVVPSSSECDPQDPLEERNSYIEAPSYPYHPLQFRVLPGPAVALPTSIA
ncbi:hypothetical protein C0995_000528 [Termitomyces sp. Mi166|nr:hypothetical protein C0995_000528 [Termitomyces sp. Mi166\